MPVFRALAMKSGRVGLAPIAMTTVLVLAGCDLFSSSSRPVVPRPETLRPEIDAFAVDSVRSLAWSETLRRGKTTTPLGQASVQVKHQGASVAGTDTIPLLAFHFAAGPSHAGAVTRNGFDPRRVAFDTSAIVDPGPALPFPEIPAPGWRHDTIIGELRFVRALRGAETLRQSGKDHRVWAFAESTWWNHELVATASTWMGLHGLVRHRSEWPQYGASVANDGATGTLVREIRAQ